MRLRDARAMPRGRLGRRLARRLAPLPALGAKLLLGHSGLGSTRGGRGFAWAWEVPVDVVAVAVLAVVVMIVRAAGAKVAVAAEVEVVVLVAVGIMAVYVIVGGEAPVEEGMLVYQPVGGPQ